MSPKVEKISEPVWLGEAPHWDADAKALFFVSIPSSTVHRYDPATGQTSCAKVEGEPVSLILPVAGSKDKFVISRGRQLCLMTWDGVSEIPTSVETICEGDTEPERLNNRFNDGKTDPTGTLWAGSMGAEPEPGKFDPAKGCLYSLGADRKLERHLTGLGIGNGLAWSADRKTMYYIDSLEFKVEAFDCDLAKPAISNRRTVFDLKANNIEGLPDGMAIDNNGNIWVCVFRGAEVLCINPRAGTLVTRLPIPSYQVTSAAFGGAALDELYVTTAAHALTADQKKAYPDAGATFRVTGLGVKGQPGVPVKL